MQPPPQQQTVVASPVVVQPAYVTRPYVTASVVNSYRDRQSAVIGILLIIGGSLSIIFNVVDLAVGSDRHYYLYSPYDYRYDSLSDRSNGISGHGIWCGIMVIIAGGFGIGAARHKTRCMINAFLVMAIIADVFAGIQLIVAATGASEVQSQYGHYFDTYQEAAAVFAMAVLLALLAAAEFALSLWGSILCCAAGGCCEPVQPAVYTMPGGQPQVTVVTLQQQQQPMQPVMMVQPPPYQPPVVYPAPPQNPGYAPPAAPGYAPPAAPGYPAPTAPGYAPGYAPAYAPK